MAFTRIQQEEVIRPTIYSSMFRRSYVQKGLCSEGSIFRGSFVQKVQFSEGSVFRRFYVQKILCSEIFVQKVLCLTRLHKSRSSRSELEFDLSNFV